MVIKERRFLTIAEAEKIYLESKSKQEVLSKLADVKKRCRQPAPPAPEGGIGLREAERKYGIISETLSKWTRQGYIPVILRTANKLYVDEKTVAEIAKRYVDKGHQGKWIIREIMKAIHTIQT